MARLGAHAARAEHAARAGLLAAEREATAIALPLGRSSPAPLAPAAMRVPRDFLRLASAIACHRDASRWDDLYRVLWRLTHGEPKLLDVATDPDVHRLATMERAVRRASHKMKAFVRFRAVSPDHAGDDTRYVAWFEPAQSVVERVSPFFARRFNSMRWSILTPDRCVHWDRATLRFTDGLPRSAAPSDDALEELWRTYYAHIFNPARLNLDAMRAEMPQRYWIDLPEARLVRELTREAPRRVAAMLAQTQAPAEPLPDEMRATSEVGLTPERSGLTAPATRGSTSATASRALEMPGEWDPVHDPGTLVASERAARVLAHAPRGIAVDSGRVFVGAAGWTDPTLIGSGRLLSGRGAHSGGPAPLLRIAVSARRGGRDVLRAADARHGGRVGRAHARALHLRREGARADDGARRRRTAATRLAASLAAQASLGRGQPARVRARPRARDRGRGVEAFPRCAPAASRGRKAGCSSAAVPALVPPVARERCRVARRQGAARRRARRDRAAQSRVDGGTCGRAHARAAAGARARVRDGGRSAPAWRAACRPPWQ